MDRKFFGNGTNAGLPEQSFWLGRIVEGRQEARTEQPTVPEPRHSVRRQRNLEVLINHGLSYSVPWQARDLSLTGAYIETDAMQLPQGAAVEVVLRYGYKGRPIELRLPASVTRVDGRGMALTFGRYDDETYTNLANLLYAV